MFKKKTTPSDRHNQQVNKILSKEQRKYEFLHSFVKMCPRCGTLNQLDARGCLSCLYQFKK